LISYCLTFHPNYPSLDHSTSRGQHITRFGGLVGMIYMIVTTEQIVRRNPGIKEDLNEWTYGQTIALIMLGQQLMDCFSYFKEELKNRQELNAQAARARPPLQP
jgi:hypothetical protein